MKKTVKIILRVLLVIAVLIVGAFMVLTGLTNHVNKNYFKYATPEGDLETKYTAMGSLEVSYEEFDVSGELWKKYEVWYPQELENMDKTYPVVVMANGTGVKASEYKEVFEHLASWGFIVIGNEDEHSRTGISSAASLDFIIKLNDDEKSLFFGKIDVNNIGIAGHSQGGVGAINAVTVQENGSIYKAIFTASAASNFWGQDGALGSEWRYDTSKINIPYFMVAGTGSVDAGTATDITATEGQGICPLWDIQYNYDAVMDTVSKVMAREVGKDHSDMLRYADGYMTAWFMYWLNGDIEAGNAFFGENAEILTNTNWQDVNVNP